MDCPVCEKGKLMPMHYSVCDSCGSEVANSDQMRANIMKYTEAELQEKLGQQRDKCVEAYDNASGDGVIQKQIIKAAIRNAIIDNDWEDE